ncbi:hypothetical protein BCR34DRAFT_602479 [Clohesyomyces aquaticus]|uniref:Uncharacterized protein n=1 Tax=Clohesyomyces aquaticus TaxID=1231657 RepID=A0A1Y1ZI22_9PLEO|nr:hypothetical protein BCR34DRAFT_602479 [Clohesyomyces aquaticus]
MNIYLQRNYTTQISIPAITIYHFLVSSIFLVFVSFYFVMGLSFLRSRLTRRSKLAKPSSDMVQIQLYPDPSSKPSTPNGTCKATINLRTCVHGYLKPDKKQRGSLMVFSARLTCSKPGRNFSRFNMNIEFLSSPSPQDPDEKGVIIEAVATSKPTILALAPADISNKKSTVEYRAKVSNEVSHGAEVNGKVGPVGAKVNFGHRLVKEVEKKYALAYFERISGSSQCRSGSAKPDTVEWTCLKNDMPDGNERLSPEYLFAVLVQRPDDAKFRLKVEVRAIAGKRDFFGKVMGRVDPETGVVENAQKVVEFALNSGWDRVSREFDPMVLGRQGEFSGIDAKNLGAFAGENALLKLTGLSK